MLQKKILLVDDDESFLSALDALLSSEGFSIIKLKNPDNILYILEKEEPDLILLDVYFPEANGFKILKLLKSHYMFSDIPVLMITADTTIQIDKAFSQGADDCIFKPLSVQYVLERISKLIYEKTM